MCGTMFNVSAPVSQGRYGMVSVCKTVSAVILQAGLLVGCASESDVQIVAKSQHMTSGQDRVPWFRSAHTRLAF